jgi:hypothetical protein
MDRRDLESLVATLAEWRDWSYWARDTEEIDIRRISPTWTGNTGEVIAVSLPPALFAAMVNGLSDIGTDDTVTPAATPEEADRGALARLASLRDSIAVTAGVTPRSGKLCACGCGQLVTSPRPEAKFATPACRVRAHRAR